MHDGVRFFRKVSLAALVFVLCIVTSPIKEAQAFNVGIHQDITTKALGFLNPIVLNHINDQHSYQDTVHAFDSAHHFDNCRLKEGTEYINELYTEANGVLDNFNPTNANPFKSTDGFGQLIHTSEDFYAHSNWVEIGRTDLIDNGLKLRKPLQPWSTLRDNVMIAQGKDLPNGWSANLPPGSKVPLLTTNSGQIYKGLISGTFGPADDCYNSIAIAHGSDGPEHLNKDDSSRPGYHAAENLAVRQAQHEWCRLLSLLNDKYGYAGSSVPMGLWVNPNGYPHPQASACGPRLRKGEHNITVSLNHIKILDDTDPVELPYPVDAQRTPFRSRTTGDFSIGVFCSDFMRGRPFFLGIGKGGGATLNVKSSLTLHT